MAAVDTEIGLRVTSEPGPLEVHDTLVISFTCDSLNRRCRAKKVESGADGRLKVVTHAQDQISTLFGHV